MQISSLIGSRILTPEGTQLGYVLNVLFVQSYKKLTCLICADDEDNEFYLPMRAVVSRGDAVIAENVRTQTPEGCACPLGKPAYAASGEALGTVEDILTDEAEIVVRREERVARFPLSRVRIGDAVIIRPEARSKKKAENITAQMGETAAAHKAENIAAQKAAEPPQAPPPAGTGKASPPADLPPAPPANPPETKSGLDRVNLLGRRVRRSVYAADGTLLIPAGERITPASISAARRANRLLQLTVNTLTNA